MSDNVIQMPNTQIEETEQPNILESAFNAMTEAAPELQGMEGVAALLAMPDKEFSILAPLVLENMEKSLNNVSDKLILVQALNASGGTSEDLIEAFARLTDEIDNQLTTLTRAKRDFVKQLIGMLCNAIADTEGIAKKIIQVPFELCHPNAKMPTYANVNDAGMDIYALEDITIHPGETIIVKTGLKCAIPKGYELQVRPKSGRAYKTKMRIANTPGTIDSGYRDEIGVIIDNIEPKIKDITFESDLVDGKPEYKITSVLFGEDMHIGEGEKFAQLVLNEIPKCAPYQVENVAAIENDGRAGGFGSTGLK